MVPGSYFTLESPILIYTKSIFDVLPESHLSGVNLSLSSPSRHPQTSFYFCPPLNFWLQLCQRAPSVFSAWGWESFRSFGSWAQLDGGRNRGEPEITGPAQREEHAVKLPFPSPLSLKWQIFKKIKFYLANTDQLLQKNSNGLLANNISVSILPKTVFYYYRNG